MVSFTRSGVLDAVNRLHREFSIPKFSLIILKYVLTVFGKQTSRSSSGSNEAVSLRRAVRPYLTEVKALSNSCRFSAKDLGSITFDIFSELHGKSADDKLVQLQQNVPLWEQTVSEVYGRVSVDDAFSNKMVWWSTPRAVGVVICLIGLVIITVTRGLDADALTGRTRLQLTALGFTIMLIGGTWFTFGSGGLAVALPEIDDDDSDSEADDLEETAPRHPRGAPAFPGEELPRYDGLSPSAPPFVPQMPRDTSQLDAFRSFGNGGYQSGPFSNTRNSLSPPAPVPLSGNTLGQQVPDGDVLRQQAVHLSSALRGRRASRTADPYWSAHFWHDVDTMNNQAGIHPQLVLLLQREGYVGQGTLTAPSAALDAGLDSFAHTNSAVPERPPLVGLNPAPAQSTIDHGRWNDRLALDIKRAAPEIYRSIRQEGASTIREYLQQQHASVKGSEKWSDLWSLATSLDFQLGQCMTDNDLFNRLGADDGLEIGLRQIASYVYEKRTKDKVGAQHMLAVAAPGAGRDIAPTWLIGDASAHSRFEHKRDLLLNQVSRGEDHRGRGRGSYGRASGTTPSAPAASGKPPDNTATRGRGRGRGRGKKA